MGGLHIQKEARTTSDLDPDPFGDGVPSTYEHNDDADDDTAAEDDIYIADGLDLDDDINVPVIDNLLKPISPTHDKSLPKTKERRKVKHKRQRPIPNSRNSYVNICSASLQNDQSSICGVNLRNEREKSKSNTTEDVSMLSIAISATSVLGVAASTKPKPKPTSKSTKPTSKSPKPTSIESQKPSPIESQDPGFMRIKELDFELSPTQLFTPEDGNCMFHCISDQSNYINHAEVRNAVVSNIYRMIDENILFWDESEYVLDWIEKMELEGTFGDHYALQVIANLLERDIIIIPTKPESAHILKKYCIIKANKIENAMQNLPC